jgi:hypothetical protein
MEKEKGKKRGGGHVAKPRQQKTSRERWDWLQRQLLGKRWRSKKSSHETSKTVQGTTSLFAGKSTENMNVLEVMLV